ncbi:hypothetical protein HX004_08040 [Myroides sp. 1354]|uniref:hypothetical protein n=1 Tax=unclassified Myroides TaxID=2642485 RepID=UPI00257783FD|nr:MULTISPECIES: hypothetical protein [unclassified Myroides]MDM1045820.1 hypothetical protein [Myroides sp. R163-1]MDM1055725.1 hypothetical protein [Myroides sp. 1354]MDM1069817.1 hypothetical protein [Myroides sp. 1372]
MKKLFFNQKGIEQKQQNMAQLPSQQLQEELLIMLYDTKNWVITNFILSKHQLEKLENAPEAFLRNFSLTSMNIVCN